MNEIRETITRLREKGWTLAAIGRELGTPANSLWRWQSGVYPPANGGAVLAVLKRLLARKKVPPKKLYPRRRRKHRP
jgi:hypothetical protein